MLVLRRAELESELDEAASRLQRVETHIHRLENQMNDRPTTEVAVSTKRLPAVHLAVASGVSPSFASADIGPVIQPLYPRLCDALGAAGVEIAGMSIAYYDDTADGGIGVHAGFPIDESVIEVPGLDVVDLPEVELAATAIHHGDMATVDVDTVAPIFDWIRDHGFRTTGYSREHYLAYHDDVSQGRTEMQFPIEVDPST
jgi:effector-binding domain-containing protein